jgi:hypothetical protein
MELYGFDEEKIDLIRSAFQVMKQPELHRQWQEQHKRLVDLTNAANTSDREKRRITL